MLANLPAAAIQQITDWRYPQDNLLLCQHVAEYGAASFNALEQKTGRSAGLWRLKWHTCWLERSGAKQSKEPYSDWELCVLLVACQPGTQGEMLSKKASFSELAKWLPGRSAAGLRQAYAHHVEGSEASILAKLTANSWPSNLCSLLAAWPGPSAKVKAALNAATEDNQRSVAAELTQELSAWAPHAKRHKCAPSPRSPPPAATAAAAARGAAAAEATATAYLESAWPLASCLPQCEVGADQDVWLAAALSSGPVQQPGCCPGVWSRLPHIQQPQLLSATDAAQASDFNTGWAQGPHAAVNSGCVRLQCPVVMPAGPGGLAQPCWDSLAAAIAVDLAAPERPAGTGFAAGGARSAGSGSSSCDVRCSAGHAATAAAAAEQEGLSELLGCAAEGGESCAGCRPAAVLRVQNGGSSQQQQLFGLSAAMDCTPGAPAGVQVQVQGQGAAAGVAGAAAQEASPPLLQAAADAAAAAAAAAVKGLQQQALLPAAPALPQPQILAQLGHLQFGQLQGLLHSTSDATSQPGDEHALGQSIGSLAALVPELRAMSRQHQLLGQQLAAVCAAVATALADPDMFQAV